MDLRVLRAVVVVSLVARTTGEYLLSSHSSAIATEAIFDASGRLFPRTSHVRTTVERTRLRSTRLDLEEEQCV